MKEAAAAGAPGGETWALGAETRIVIGPAAGVTVERAAAYLQGEVARRTGLRWEVVRGGAPGAGDVALEAPGDGTGAAAGAGPAPEHPEEIAIWCGGDPQAPQVRLRAGSDAAMMAAAGRFARSLAFPPDGSGPARTQRSGLRQRPAFPVRGHCLANHKQTTTYDHWDWPRWESYLAEMAAWGSNIAVVYPLHPARWVGSLPFGDGPDGAGQPWFDTPAREREFWRQWEIQLRLPDLCHALGMRYGMWMPTNDVFPEEVLRHPELTRYGGAYACLAVPAARRRIHAIRERLFAALPRMDVLFLPSKDDGGCPGCEYCTPWGPHYLELAQEQGALARQHHPGCRVWLATQGLTGAETAGLLRWLDGARPDWVEGVAYGPYSELMTFAGAGDERGGSDGGPEGEAGGEGDFSLERYARSGPVSAGVARLRAAVPGRYRIILYPDETHTLRCQYPVLGMDRAVQFVWQREDGPAPRPREMAALHAATSALADGSVPYSEGNTDDVNKAIWSALDWDPGRSAESVAAEYAAWFFGPRAAAGGAQLILSTEAILNGPLYGNGAVATARALLDGCEGDVPALLANWRWLNLRLGLLMLDFIQRVLHRDRQLGKELRYRVATWHHEPDPLPGARRTVAYLERRFAETEALLEECVWTRDRLFALQGLAVRGVVRLQHSYMHWDVLLARWREAIAGVERGEVQGYPAMRQALVVPLQQTESSFQPALEGVRLVDYLQEYEWEQGPTRWQWP